MSIARQTVAAGLLAAVFLLAGPMATAGENLRTFTGADTRRNLHFSTPGAWELRWQAEGNASFPQMSPFEVHLYETRGDRFLGIVAKNTGNGFGSRYIEDGGRYYFDVLATNVKWKLDIVKP